MFDTLEILNLSSGIARHSGARQSLVARNIANANTPGYRPMDIGEFSPQKRDFNDTLRQTRPGHFQAQLVGGQAPQETSGQARPNGNAVSLQSEMVKAAEVRHRHQMAVSVYGTAMDILRTSLGRR